jgi:LMBR1 domain-containing protein 1
MRTAHTSLKPAFATSPSPVVPTPHSPAHHHHLHTTVLIAIAVTSLVLSLLTVRHFLSPSVRRLHVVVASAGAVFIGFTTILLPSLDVYVTSARVVPPETLQHLYLVLFSMTGVWLSAVLPLSFFFAKSNVNLPLHRRLCNAIQSTGMFIAVLVFLLITGLIFRPGHETWSSEPLTQQWMNNVFDTQHQGTSALLFLTGVLASIGCFGFILYTAYGMATLPLDLIRGYKDSELERLEVETESIQIKSRLRQLEKQKKASNRAAVMKLEQALDIKRQHIRALDQLTNGKSRVRLIGPCRVIAGSLLLGITCLLTCALMLSASDPGLEDASGCRGSGAAGAAGGGGAGGGAAAAGASSNSPSAAVAAAGNIVVGSINNVVKLVCQAETGYLGTLLNKPQLFNPFDEVLVYLSSFFPLDLVVLSGALAFMFAASLYGVLRLGLRCCVCLAVYRFKRKGTSSSAILVFGAVAMFISLALLVQVPALAPKYATFGQQTVGGTVHCSLSDEAKESTALNGRPASDLNGVMMTGSKNAHCTMSQVAVLLVTLVKEFPIYSHIFYVTSWLHAIVVGLSLLWRSCCGGKASNFTDNDFNVMGGDVDEGDVDSDVELASKRGLLSMEEDEMEEDTKWGDGSSRYYSNERVGSARGGSGRSKFGSVLAGRYGSN